MKQLFYLLTAVLLTLAIFIFPSCKKEPNSTTGNNNQGTPRTGLALLTDPQAQTYCVIITTSGDTLIWQNTRDTVAYSGGPLLSFSTGVNPFMSSQFTSAVPKDNIKTFYVMFQNADSSCSMNPQCSAGDYLIQTGPMTINENFLILTSIDAEGDWLDTWNDNLSSPFQILSITRTPVTGTCDVLRVKARFSNVLMHLNHCVVSNYAAQGEFVMDFQFNKQ